MLRGKHGRKERKGSQSNSKFQAISKYFVIFQSISVFTFLIQFKDYRKELKTKNHVNKQFLWQNQ